MASSRFKHSSFRPYSRYSPAKYPDVILRGCLPTSSVRKVFLSSICDTKTGTPAGADAALVFTMADRRRKKVTKSLYRRSARFEEQTIPGGVQPLAVLLRNQNHQDGSDRGTTNQKQPPTTVRPTILALKSPPTSETLTRIILPCNRSTRVTVRQSGHSIAIPNSPDWA
jgi:hypothetical protein